MCYWIERFHRDGPRRISYVDIGGTVLMHINDVAFICSVLVGVFPGGGAVFGFSSVSLKLWWFDIPWRLSKR